MEILRDNPETRPRVSELTVTGMTCANCARHVTEALQGVAGVAGAEVSLAERRAKIRWKEGSEAGTDRLIDAVRGAGYEAKEAAVDKGGKGLSVMAGWRFNVVVGLAGTVPLMAGEWLFRLGGKNWFDWGSFAVALVIWVGGGACF